MNEPLSDAAIVLSKVKREGRHETRRDSDDTIRYTWIAILDANISIRILGSRGKRGMPLSDIVDELPRDPMTTGKRHAGCRTSRGWLAQNGPNTQGED